MARAKVKFVCQECGYEAPRWLGHCPGCGAWNSFVEEMEAKPQAAGSLLQPRVEGVSEGHPTPITAVDAAMGERHLTGIGEFDRVLGGGIVPGSIALVGGDPGVGKSTLLLQVASAMALAGGRVLYVSGEESAAQVRLRAERVGALTSGLFVLAETNLAAVEKAIASAAPQLVIVDSIQTVYHPELTLAPGSVGQIRESAAFLMRLAKATGVPILLVGHVTKNGELAGPRVLEHIVDTVMYLEGDRFLAYRVLRSVKNRFGSTDEIGVFAMGDRGLTQVVNPSELFLSERAVRHGPSPGSVVVASVEGSRPVLVELQALVASSSYGLPRRVSIGVDQQRTALVLAVLEKRVGLSLANQDAYVKVAGGVRVDEPAVDLGLAIAVVSSFRDRPVNPGLLAVGEVGLGGEIRSVARVQARVAEAARLGFTTCLVPAGNLAGPAGQDLRTLPTAVIGVGTLAEALEAAQTAAS